MRYIVDHPEQVLGLLGQQLALTGAALALAVIVALPLGVFAARNSRVRGPLLALLDVIYTIPSLAMFVLLIPFVGLGFVPALIALVAYAQIILVRNIVAGMQGIDPTVLEAARGIGMTPWQCFWRIEIPLALPVMLAGVRVATLITISIGTLAAFINAGGLGTLLFTGVAQSHPEKIIAGAIGVAALALAAHALMRALEGRALKALRD
jgi:osmoprotectant transport system permease protein